MASIRKHPNGYRAEVYVRGRRTSKVMRTMREAQAWAGAEEARLAAPAGNAGASPREFRSLLA